MEYNDWTPQSIITLIAGVPATIALIAATAYTYTKGGSVNKKRLFFSLKGVDINDDDALAAFTQHVWQHASAAFTEERDIPEIVEDTGSDRGIGDDS